MIKLVTIDIDDTLVNSAKEITPRVKQAIQAATAQGVKIVLTTGRPLTGVVGYLQELGLADQADQYVITYNGGVVETTSGVALGGAINTLADYRDLRAVADDLGAYLQTETLNGAFTTNQVVNKWASFENYIVQMDLSVVPVEAMSSAEQYVKFMFIGEAEEIQKWSTALPADIYERFYVVKSTPHNLEFMHKDATKGNGLKVLADKLGIAIDETMALGDQANDLTMIEAAGLGVAMENAVPAVKAAAQAITTSQNADGVGVAIEKYVLQPSV
ncbi:MAG: Cof-type HAD-IIB family hydrolase [Lactobacillaceae bacterium]|jgi:Cof subfamily protein (haloacid dehalogenase superfamily)|nr:Cof-type HAD-IIB family hydrolase [Lactobacillaceae bacterium]